MMQSLPPNTPFSLGKDANGDDIIFRLSDMVNPHIVFCGKSGSGKTHNIVHIIDFLIERGLTFHIIGFHADFAYRHFQERGATRAITDDRVNHLRFQYSNSDISLNPFSFDPHIDHGGVVNAVKQVVNVIQLFHTRLGDKQKGYLEKALMDVYIENGFRQDDPLTWRRQQNLPDLSDLLNLLNIIFSNISSELNECLYLNIKKLRNDVAKNRAIMNDLDASSSKADAARDMYKADVNALSELFNKLVEQDGLGIRHTAFYSDWDRNTVNGLRDIIDRMINTTLFTGQSAVPRKGCVNFYDISKLSTNDQETMTFILLNKIYTKAIIDTGDDMSPEFPSSYIVADEGRYIAAAAKSPMSPINLIMGGARKFGLGLMVGIQGAHQMSKDMSDNFALKFVVQSDESSESDTKKAFGLNATQMRKLKPRKNAWINTGKKVVLVDTWK